MSYRDDLSTVLGYAWAMAENLEADSARELREAVERIRQGMPARWKIEPYDLDPEGWDKLADEIIRDALEP